MPAPRTQWPTYERGNKRGPSDWGPSDWYMIVNLFITKIIKTIFTRLSFLKFYLTFYFQTVTQQIWSMVKPIQLFQTELSWQL